jgi:4-amino-4-deoxychorismate lyase
MSRFIETIRLEEGQWQLLPYHQKRLELALRDGLGWDEAHIHLESLKIPVEFHKGIWKCRILYEYRIEKVEFFPHSPMQVRSLKVVHGAGLDYRHKYSDRSKLAALMEQRDDCDDILIIRDGCLSDSYMANVVCWDGSHWYTPDTPLLPGCMRAYLLDQGKIRTQHICESDLGKYQKFRLINALNRLEESPDIGMEQVRF